MLSQWISISNSDSLQTNANIQVVDGSRPFDPGTEMVSTSAFFDSDIRYIQEGMGRASQSGKESSGSMETTPKISTHPCVGASSCQELPKSICVQGQEQVDSDTNRQHNSSQLH